MKADPAYKSSALNDYGLALMAIPNVASPVVAPAGGPGAAARQVERRAWIAALVVAALTVAGAVLRVIVAHQSVFADELSTYWISATHGLETVLSLLYSTGRIHHAEITPPLSFLASWLTTRAGNSPELLRLPALVAGTATIPLVYLLGLRTVGRRAAVLAAAATALSPFMIYYSAEARAYGLLMFLVASSTLSMLIALDTGRRRWWVVYAVCSAASFYTHYTCLFVLGVQLVWVLWTEPGARRAALLASAGAVVLVLPWVPGLIQDTRSPTVKILSALSPFTGRAIRIDIQHWALGYPYTVAGGVKDLPGVPSLVILAVAAVLAAVGVVVRAMRDGLRRPSWRVVLVVALALATPVGEIVISAFGNHILGVRDLAASWPFLALAAAAFVFAARPKAGIVAAALAVLAFALAAPKMLERRFSRPDYQAAATYVATHARPGDVVVDGTGGLSPGPLTGFDVAYHGSLPVYRALAPAERDHPFTVFDPLVPVRSAVGRAVASARGGRLFTISVALPGIRTPDLLAVPELQGRYRRESQTRWGGIQTTIVTVYARAGATGP
jgi:hypothetical protein